MHSPEPDNSGVPLAKLPGSRLEEIFGARAREFPNRVAVSAGGKAMTYAELDQASGRVANVLRNHGVSSGSLVGLYMSRGVQMIIGMLGILKSGGGYLPVDPSYVSARAQFILDDSKVDVLVTETAIATSLNSGARQIVLIEEALANDAALATGEPGVSIGHALAYVIYTSGSTGKPKGVVVTQHNVIRLFEQAHPWFGFDEQDVWCVFHSIGFDFSVWEIWGALLYGGRVVIVPYGVTRSPESFRKLVADEGVTVLNQTPSAFRNFDEADRAANGPLALRYIIFGGELLVPNSLASWISRHGDSTPSLVNMYGITETTVHVTYKVMRRHDIVGWTASSIGQPIPDLTVHLLDQHRKPVADGVAGEMYIEGPGVALGYLHRPELTQQRFVALQPANPGAAPVRAYKTGDVAIRDKNGDLFYEGRCDDQIKVRGFRIEPHEIETVLLKNTQIVDCCIVTHDYGEGDVRLVAYVIPGRRGDAGEWNGAMTDQLTRLAAAELPDYMRPSAYVVLDALPLTAHGKIDKHVLPSPQSSAWIRRDADCGEMPSEETFIVSLWSGEIGLKGIRPTDDFFDYGGTSLALIRSLSMLKKHYQLDLNPGLLAAGATARNLANFIRAASRKAD